MLDLSTSQVFGNNGPLHDNFVVYSTEKGPDQIVFSAGCLLGSWNVQTRTTKFFESKQQKGEVDALTISPDDKWIAAACRETSGDSKLIVYRTSNRKRAANLTQKGRVRSLCFTGNSKQLICAGEDSIFIWSWESNTLDFSATFSGTISKISCPPKFSGPTLLMTSTGKNHSRLWMANSSHRISNTRINLTEAEEIRYDFRDHTWLTNIGSKKSLLLAIVMEPHARKSSPCEASSINLYKIYDGISSSRPRLEFDQTINTGLEKGVKIATISLTPKGFAVGSSKGISFFDHKLDSEGKISFINAGQAKTDDNETIFTIKRSKSESNTLFLLTNRFKIYQTDVDDVLYSNDAFEEIISEAGHVGGVDDMDCCVEKPYIVSCGKDSKVKIW